MSNVTMRVKPARRQVSTAPTMPPAGPESTQSLPRKRRASVSPPWDCMKKRRVAPSAELTDST